MDLPAPRYMKSLHKNDLSTVGLPQPVQLSQQLLGYGLDVPGIVVPLPVRVRDSSLLLKKTTPALGTIQPPRRVPWLLPGSNTAEA
jgi:hypothetical protein